jgi:arsenate reductase
MAEGFARHLLGDLLDVFSAGIEARGLDPYAVRVMKEVGIDISNQQSKTISSVANIEFGYVITLCDAAQKNCPFFPAKYKIIHQGFDDPGERAAEETDEEKILMHYREVRDDIRKYIEALPIFFREKPFGSTP